MHSATIKLDAWFYLKPIKYNCLIKDLDCILLTFYFARVEIFMTVKIEASGSTETSYMNRWKTYRFSGFTCLPYY